MPKLAADVNDSLALIVNAGNPLGRPLFAANRDITAIGDPVAQLWQHCTTLREHRGDGHVIALAAARLDGCQAHQLLIASRGFPAEVFRDNRGWTHEQWEDAAQRLRQRDLMDEQSLTGDGKRLHDEIERLTDSLAYEPIGAALSEPAINDLIVSLTPATIEISSSGVLPFPNPMGLPMLSAS
jgi:hypothetical protein